MDRLSMLLEFLKDDPDDAFNLYAIALEYTYKNEILAEEYFNKLMLKHPDYIGTYYQAGKLAEAMHQTKKAEDIYRKGIEIAQATHNNHALAELRSALNNLLLELDED